MVKKTAGQRGQSTLFCYVDMVLSYFLNIFLHPYRLELLSDLSE